MTTAVPSHLYGKAEKPDEAFELLKFALNDAYANLMPEGFSIYRIAEYDPKLHTAASLTQLKRANPKVKYIVTLTSDTCAISQLGETVNEAVRWCIMELEKNGY